MEGCRQSELANDQQFTKANYEYIDGPELDAAISGVATGQLP
jgi:hypothetical protein